MKALTIYIIAISVVCNLFLFSCKNEKDVYNENVVCNAEILSKDSTSFISSNKFSGFFGNGRNQSSEQARSGQYSALTNKKKPFAFTYNINNVLANDSFLIDVWRFSKSVKASLVVSAEKSDIFYMSQNVSSQKDENGWELLTINVVVPQSVNNKLLKIYVWNPDTTEVAYFDDLKIQYLNKPKPY